MYPCTHTLEPAHICSTACMYIHTFDNACSSCIHVCRSIHTHTLYVHIVSLHFEASSSESRTLPPPPLPQPSLPFLPPSSSTPSPTLPSSSSSSSSFHLLLPFLLLLPPPPPPPLPPSTSSPSPSSSPSSLCRQVAAINKLAEAGMHFWDYGNGFLKEAGKADAAVFRLDKQCGAFSYPSYVEDIMG